MSVRIPGVRVPVSQQPRSAEPAPAALIRSGPAALRSGFEDGPRVRVVKPPAPPPKPAAPPLDERAEWPGGAPSTRLRSRIEQVKLEVSVADKQAVVLSVLPANQATRAKALFDAPDGVTAQSLDAAYAAVLEARKSPGTKTLLLSLVPVLSQVVGSSEGVDEVRRFDGPPLPLKPTLEVTAGGLVNGKLLKVDSLAKLSSQLSTVPADAKDMALRAAGLSKRWVESATPEQKDTALAQLRLASLTPGKTTLDLSIDVSQGLVGDGVVEVHRLTERVTLNVSADGKVNGQTPAIEAALATTLTMERMPMVEKRLMLASLGLPQQVLAGIQPAEASALLSRIALRSKSPGTHQLEFGVAGKPWLMALKVGAKGIEGAGAMEKPKDPPWWKEALGPVLSIVSIAFPPAAPFLQVANALYAIDQGAKGLGLVAAVAGAAAGVGVISGASNAATLGSLANSLGAANGVVTAVKTGNVLAAFSSVVSLAGTVGTLANLDLGDGFSVLQAGGRIAGTTSRALDGDWSGVLSDGFHALNERAKQVEEKSSLYSLSGSGVKLGDAGGGTRLGTGDDGAQYESEPQAPGGFGVPGSRRDVFLKTPITANFVDARGIKLTGPAPTPEGSMDAATTKAVADAPITANSMMQAALGNCFLLSTMQQVALRNPGALDARMTFSGDGASVTVRLFDRNGSPVNVTVDASYPMADNSVVKLSEDSAEAGVKAYLFQKAIVAAMPQLMRSDDPKYAAGWGSVSSGGWPSNVLTFISGQPSEKLEVSDLSAGVLYERIVQATVNGQAVVADTKPFGAPGPTFAGLKADVGLVGLHAYSIIGAYRDATGKAFVRVQNPWGAGELGTVGTSGGRAADGVNDGVMSVPLADFVKNFRSLYTGGNVALPVDPPRVQTRRIGVPN